MTEIPIILECFEHKEFPEGHIGDFYVIGYSDDTQRMVYMLWEVGDDKYNYPIFIKQGHEQNMTKDEDSGYAKIRGSLSPHLSIKEDASNLSCVIKAWQAGPAPDAKKLKSGLEGAGQRTSKTDPQP